MNHRQRQRRCVIPLLLVAGTAAKLWTAGLTWAAPPRIEREILPSRATQDENLRLEYSHVHFYCDALRPLEEYKALEGKLNKLGDVKEAGAADADYSPIAQDLVEQLLVGLGWRVTASHEGPGTQTVVVSSADTSGGAQFVISAPRGESAGESGEPEELLHFDRLELQRFSSCHSGRQGIAVLGFETGLGGVDTICARYKDKHPQLLATDAPLVYDGARVLEVYAYYLPGRHREEADKGTILRFIERTDSSKGVLPGVQAVPATFEASTQPAYSDHWVSNVFDREGFLTSLKETLGFTPKVDFNAGVVAAGEAQIESTVTGNDPQLVLDKAAALVDREQIYLPINNHLTDVGHVHLFLQELGQGVQHLATRVPDLPSLIQHANDRRKATGAGLSFLRIPQSYYGFLTAERLHRDSGIELAAAERIVESLIAAGIVDRSSNTVSLEASRQEVLEALPDDVSEGIAEFVLQARYNNLYQMLGENLSDEMYMKIVRNNILVDVQGEDVLMQIFTAPVLQRDVGQEAPFLEFIQRLCSVCREQDEESAVQMRPGCGGFGIRNFLTLFISIELSKAAQAKAEAEASGDLDALAVASKTLEALMSQLEESNPILNTISEAMTAEGRALEKNEPEEAARWAAKKATASEALQALSGRYAKLTASIRTGAA